MFIRKVLITGSSGFLGLNIAEAMLASGTDVIGFDPNVPLVQALADFARLPGRFESHRGDVRDAAALRDLAAGCDAIVHAGAITPHPTVEAAKSEDAATINIVGSINAVRAAAVSGSRKMVFLGSASIYGPRDAAVSVLDEATAEPSPRSVYAVTKFAAERMVERVAESEGVSLRILRVGSVFGPWEHASGVRGTLSPILQATQHACSKAGPCILPRAGQRDWIYSRDVADAVLRALDAELSPEPINIGSGREWSVADWCALLAEHCAGFAFHVDAQNANIDFHGAHDRPPLAVERLRQRLNFEPRFDMRAAFDDYKNWLASHPRFVTE